MAKCTQCSAYRAVARNWEANAKEWRRMFHQQEEIIKRLRKLLEGASK